MAADYFAACWLHKALTNPDLAKEDHKRPSDAEVVAFVATRVGAGVTPEHMFTHL